MSAPPIDHPPESRNDEAREREAQRVEVQRLDDWPADDWSRCVQALFNRPSDWRWVKLSVIEHASYPRETAHSLVYGGIPTGERYKSGPRKGRLKRTLRPGTEEAFVVSFAQFDAFTRGPR